MDDKPLQALANKFKTPTQESQRKGFFRLQQVKKHRMHERFLIVIPLLNNDYFRVVRSRIFFNTSELPGP